MSKNDIEKRIINIKDQIEKIIKDYSIISRVAVNIDNGIAKVEGAEAEDVDVSYPIKHKPVKVQWKKTGEYKLLNWEVKVGISKDGELSNDLLLSGNAALAFARAIDMQGYNHIFPVDRGVDRRGSDLSDVINRSIDRLSMDEGFEADTILLPHTLHHEYLEKKLKKEFTLNEYKMKRIAETTLETFDRNKVGRKIR